MSGISLAVAPRSDPDHGSERQPTAMLGGVMGSLRVIELQLVAFIMVFSASGLVPLVDLAFPVATTLYLLAVSRLAFPPLHSKLHPAAPSASPEIFRGSKLFQAYVVVGTTVGLFLPLAHVLGGFARGDDAAVRAATPHLFLLSCQILTENVVGSLDAFSPPVRALVPLLYTVLAAGVREVLPYEGRGVRQGRRGQARARPAPVAGAGGRRRQACGVQEGGLIRELSGVFVRFTMACVACNFFLG
ncbi:unnamed protein product [Urochloa decumbens]|uniref:DUF7733 domain-containing protein n=1 Tax=Urochloa decumbens TaxID=240449 RepID=A0ABC9CY09_9POAL